MNVYKTLYFVEIRLTSHSTVIILIPGLAGQSFKMVKTNFGLDQQWQFTFIQKWLTMRYKNDHTLSVAPHGSLQKQQASPFCHSSKNIIKLHFIKANKWIMNLISGKYKYFEYVNAELTTRCSHGWKTYNFANSDVLGFIVWSQNSFKFWQGGTFTSLINAGLRSRTMATAVGM